MPSGDPDELVEAVASEALSLFERDPTIKVVGLGDGHVAPQVDGARSSIA